VKDPGYKDAQAAFKKALRPPEKGESVPVEESLSAVRAFAGLADERVFKSLVKSVRVLHRAVEEARVELDEATERLEQVRGPHFREMEQYYRDHGHFPETILLTRKEALETLGKAQAEAAAVYDAWVRIREAVYRGLGTNLETLGGGRDRMWKTVVKEGAEAKDPEVRAALCHALERIPDPRAEEILLEVEEAAEESLEVTIAALTALSHRRSVPGFERIRMRLADERWGVVVAAIRGIGLYRRPEVIPALVERLRTAEGRIHADLVEALFDLTGKHVPDTYEAWASWWKTQGEEFLPRWSEDKEKRLSAIEDIGLSDPDEIDVSAELAALLPRETEPELRQEILDFLAIHRSQFARLTLIRVLEDPEKSLRIAAIRGLAHYRHLSVPEALMRRVEEADEEELMAIFQALRRLWGGADDFSVDKPDREALRRWWRLNKDRVGRHFVRLGARDVAAGKTPPKLEGRWQDRNFYGIQIRSKRVLLVVDISLSMEEPAVEGQERKKIEVAKQELTRAIRSLPEDAVFGLVVFADVPEVWRDGMMEVDPAVRKSALEWAAALTTRLATNLYDTLELCFRIGTPESDLKSVTKPDTIFLVSDGAPTVGRFTNGDTILEHVRRWNEHRRIKIHAIGVGHDHDVDFLRKLAENNGGLYVAR
jgi:HEAT repeat protein